METQVSWRSAFKESTKINVVWLCNCGTCSATVYIAVVFARNKWTRRPWGMQVSKGHISTDFSMETCKPPVPVNTVLLQFYYFNLNLQLFCVASGEWCVLPIVCRHEWSMKLLACYAMLLYRKKWTSHTRDRTDIHPIISLSDIRKQLHWLDRKTLSCHR
jgi:hypothetical protein